MNRWTKANLLDALDLRPAHGNHIANNLIDRVVNCEAVLEALDDTSRRQPISSNQLSIRARNEAERSRLLELLGLAKREPPAAKVRAPLSPSIATPTLGGEHH
jgi:hypothetical protein